MNLNYFRLNEGDTVVNLGAHQGKATLFFSCAVGKSGRVISVEPLAENFSILERAVKRYRCDNVTLINAAIGDRDGEGNLFVGSHVSSSTTRNQGRGTQRVVVVTWDKLVQQMRLKEVALAKVDVEGAELQWLTGMTTLYPKHIIMEEHSRFGYELSALYEMLKNKGYKWTKKGLHIYATREKESRLPVDDR